MNRHCESLDDEMRMRLYGTSFSIAVFLSLVIFGIPYLQENLIAEEAVREYELGNQLVRRLQRRVWEDQERKLQAHRKLLEGLDEQLRNRRPHDRSPAATERPPQVWC